jgi:hypothetical protein
MPSVSRPKTVLLLPIGSNIVKENSDSAKDFTTRREARNYDRRHAKGEIANEGKQKRNCRSINSGQVHPVRNSSGALNPAGIIQNTTSLQISGALFQTG